MRNLGSQAALRELLRDGTSWCELATVDAIEVGATAGVLLDVTLQPSGRQCQARYSGLGAGAGAGFYWPVAVGDEVLVLFPAGDPNLAVALPGLPSGAAMPPSSWDGTRPELVHPEGLTVRLAEDGAVKAVVVETLLPALNNAFVEVKIALSGLGLPTTQIDALLAALGSSFRAAALRSE